MKKPFIEIDPELVYRTPFNVNPIEGYEKPINKETGEEFPNCCRFHSDNLKYSQEWFDKFPSCCEEHSKMVGKWWFKRENFTDIANKTITQLSYTEFFIYQRIDNEDWDKDITDYIEYNTDSYGAPAVGVHLYLLYLRDFIELGTTKIGDVKKERLIGFIDSYFEHPKVEVTNLNVLYKVYHDWLSIFPFDMTVFKEYKDSYEKQFPVLREKPVLNPYTKLATAKMHTRTSLIEFLLKTTNSLLTKINVLDLYEKGMLTEPEKIGLELVIKSRKMDLETGYLGKEEVTEQKFRRIIKKWLKDEKEFIIELMPFLSKTEPRNELAKNKYEAIFSNDLAYSLFLKWHEIHKGQSQRYLANYSFLYNALQTDKLVVCGNSDFVSFLSGDFEIVIDRIDSRKSGKEDKRFNLYQSLKASLEPKAQ